MINIKLASIPLLFVGTALVPLNNAQAAGANHIYQHNASEYSSKQICDGYHNGIIKNINKHKAQVITIAPCNYYASYKNWTYWGVRYFSNAPIIKGDKIIK